MITRIATIAGILGVLLLNGCSMDSFLFNTETLSEYSFSDSVVPAKQVEAVTLRSGSETLYGFYIKQPDSLRVAPHPTILYHHGNKHNVEEYWDRVQLLYRAGFDVFIYDYRGFGMSTGSSSEEGLHEDALAALNYLRSRADVDTTQIVDYGYSLGGVPAMYLAAYVHTPKCIITEDIFASSEALVRTGTILNIPGNYLMKGKFNNVANAALRKAPYLLIHGTHDTFIPFEHHGRLIFDNAAQPKTLRLVEGADHIEVPKTMGEDKYIELITTYIRGN